ncbi:hypothetical protein P5V15_014337 [Pogonomyrmex californicus]
MAAIKNLLIVILIFAIGNCVPLQDDEVVENSERLEFRLPKNIIPIHYDIKLITHFEDNFTTNGEVNIDIKVREPTNTIALHALNLTIHESLTEITRKGVNDVNSKSKYIPKQHKYDELTQILTLQFEELLDPETYMLRINFDGIILLNKRMRGFYKDFYTDNKGNDVAKNKILSDIIMKSSKQEQIDKIKAFAEQHSIDIKEYLDRRENYLTVLNSHLQQIQSILENALDGIN